MSHIAVQMLTILKRQKQELLLLLGGFQSGPIRTLYLFLLQFIYTKCNGGKALICFNEPNDNLNKENYKLRQNDVSKRLSGPNYRMGE